MKVRKIVLPIFMGVLLFVQSSFSANPYKGMSWAVGQWAQYTMKTERGDMNIKYSITGTETREGKTYYWFETSMDLKEGKTIMKMLMSTDGGEPKQLIMKNGDQPAMDMTSMMSRGRQQMNRPPIHGDTEINKGIIGIEPVTVPAGTFTATHSKIISNDGKDTNDIWVSSSVPILGAVKSQSSGSHSISLTLLKYGTSGAKTEITETPQKFEMPNMQQMMRNAPKDDN